MMRITIQFTGWAVTKILKLVGVGGGGAEKLGKINWKFGLGLV